MRHHLRYWPPRRTEELKHLQDQQGQQSEGVQQPEPAHAQRKAQSQQHHRHSQAQARPPLCLLRKPGPLPGISQQCSFPEQYQQRDPQRRYPVPHRQAQVRRQKAQPQRQHQEDHIICMAPYSYYLLYFLFCTKTNHTNCMICRRTNCTVQSRKKRAVCSIFAALSIFYNKSGNTEKETGGIPC